MTTSPVLSPALQDSIKHLYQVFERYPLRRHIEGCACGCLPSGAAEELPAVPLHDLTGPHLSLFSVKTMTTWGDDVDFKHFLPRLLELIAHDQLSAVEILLGKLTYSQWWSWTDQESRAVDAFLHAWWDDVLAREDAEDPWEPCEVAAVLECIAQAAHDLTPYLTHWAKIDSPFAVQHLAAFVLSEADGLGQGQLQGAYWTIRTAQAQQVVQWLLDSQQQAWLESAAPTQTDTTRREQLEMAAYTLSVAKR
ncbi:hypothetical protein GO986_21285 [Deinococcus sp. HMF7620]|uniref:Uncharacterized protein n=1 Tax=Deinococcus arboris TaxID=2682977 RepID=A0A7C9HUC0_9DEIO|nr:hypothetical protein [Deinococcus arboris]MVN89272.1 hypothetical protein [Deinococcus arboris]